MIYIALEDLNFFWKKEEFIQVIKFWHEGHSVEYISEKLNRDLDEVALLIIDVAEHSDKLIKKRTRGIYNSQPITLSRMFNVSLLGYLERKEVYEMFIKSEINFFWTYEDVEKFGNMWRSGLDIITIAKHLNRKVLEVALLAIDRCRKNEISPREIGLGVAA